MNTNFTSYVQLIDTEEKARLLLERIRWGTDPKCPKCETLLSGAKHLCQNTNLRCKKCKRYYSVRTGTIIESTHMPFLLIVQAALHEGKVNPGPDVSDFMSASVYEYFMRAGALEPGLTAVQRLEILLANLD